MFRRHLSRISWIVIERGVKVRVALRQNATQCTLGLNGSTQYRVKYVNGIGYRETCRFAELLDAVDDFSRKPLVQQRLIYL